MQTTMHAPSAQKAVLMWRIPLFRPERCLSSLRTWAPLAASDLAKGLLLEERQLGEQVSELEALIPFDVHEGVGEPVESETPHPCTFIPQGLRAPRMGPHVQHPTPRIIAAAVFDIASLGARKEGEEFSTVIEEVRPILRQWHGRAALLGPTRSRGHNLRHDERTV